MVLQSASYPPPFTAEVTTVLKPVNADISALLPISDLLSITTVFLCFTSSKSCLSSLSSGFVMSNTASTRSASSILLFASSTPMLSTRSSVSLIPAVSARRSIISPTVTVSSITSRVVPATSVTIERSAPLNIFISVDFPTFGLPTITVSIPSRKTLPAL